MPSTKQKIIVRPGDDIAEKLERAAERDGVSVSAVVEAILRVHFGGEQSSGKIGQLAGPPLATARQATGGKAPSGPVRVVQGPVSSEMGGRDRTSIADGRIIPCRACGHEHSLWSKCPGRAKAKA